MGILDKIKSLFCGKRKQRKFESFIDENWEKWAERSYYYGMKKEKAPLLWCFLGNFAVGEYTLALRLTSELVDLRAGYANPNRAAEPHGWVDPDGVSL